jgi:hypothetical protein
MSSANDVYRRWRLALYSTTLALSSLVCLLLLLVSCGALG